ncbi:MAG: hypothetical protein U0736_04215 [Gemmataceae bacterium]
MQPTPAAVPAAEPRTEDAPDDGHGHDEEHAHLVEWLDLLRIGLVALAAVASWFGWSWHVAGVDAIGLVATVAATPSSEAVANLLARRMTMELSMTIAGRGPRSARSSPPW